MVPDTLLFPRQGSSGCPPCPPPPPCSCGPNEQCVQIERTSCDTCNMTKCIPIVNSTTGSSHGVSAGAVAGAVVASVVFLATMVLVYLWYRRRVRLRNATAAEDSKPDAPARAEDVLNRPDPNEKRTTQAEPQDANTVRIYAGTSNTTINLDPEAQGESVAGTQGHNTVRASVQSNPFTDSHSIQSVSTGTQSNVIPIALVPPGSVLSSASSAQATSGTGPARPTRSPDLDLGLGLVNASNESVPSSARYAQSTRSGMTNIRNSYLTTGSYSSEFLNEAPVIVTPASRTVKQVVGLVKAEVIRTPPGSAQSSVYTAEDGGTPKSASSSVASRPSARSPLAASSFGPSDVMHGISEEHEEQEVTVRTDPFADEHSLQATVRSPTSTARTSPAPTAATFGDSEENWDPQNPRAPLGKRSAAARPESFMTQAGSIIAADIGTASRVHLGLNQLSHAPMTARTLGVPPIADLPHTPHSAALSTPRSPYRMTSAKLISPQISVDDQTPTTRRGALEQQQRRAFEELDARMSRASVVSSTSTRADSILEGFPFVPPSPISDRPIRTPPRSPLAQTAFNGQPTQTTQTATSPLKTASAAANAPLPPPPNRKQLGMSAGSQLSTMSNGLGSFPFQIDSGNGPEVVDAASSPPSSFGIGGRQRASLDTLALTADLSSYPLGFDKTAMEHYPGPPRRS